LLDTIGKSIRDRCPQVTVEELDAVGDAKPDADRGVVERPGDLLRPKR
jgi:hypothetical protein